MSGVWSDLILTLIGGGALSAGIGGLLFGGDLPPVKFPERIKPLMQLIWTLTLFIGMTLLLEKGTPDLAERVIAALKG